MTRMKTLAIAFLASLALIASSCGSSEVVDTSSDDSGSDAEAADSSSDGAAEDSTAEDDGDTEEDASADEEAEEAMEDTAEGTVEDSESAVEPNDDGLGAGTVGEMLALNSGIEFDDEGCLEDRGIDLSIPAAEADPEYLEEAQLALLICHGDDVAALFPDPGLEGIDDDAAKCVLSEAFAALGELPVEDALAEMDSTTITDEFSEVVIPAATAACGVTPEQVLEVLGEG